MASIILRALFAAFLVIFAGTLAAPPTHAATFSTAEAAAHVGETATVTGKVVNVYHSRKGNVFLNFDQPYPNETFSGVIFASSVSQFGDLSQYQGKQTQVTGTISLYRGKPEIILETPSQLRVAP